MKTLIATAAGCALGLVTGAALAQLGPMTTGVTVAVVAGLVLLIEWINALRRTRRARHVAQKGPLQHLRVIEGEQVRMRDRRFRR